ncbi:trypsin inhibitor like cysteine rich domain-containing protein [Phthorimaea operculella]|nr:trypsin inhibitor like cysteine rich domain-containing protein [Phthorimaea operculella]
MTHSLVLFLLPIFLLVGTSQAADCATATATSGDGSAVAECQPNPEPVCKGPNEALVKCPSCKSDSCEDADKLVKCPAPDPATCKSECRCIENYYRNASGVCGPRSACSPCPPNEYMNYCAPCKPDSCFYRNKNYTCPIQIAVCRARCVCIEGYYRNDDLVCVPEKECRNSKPPAPVQQPVCGVNEEWGCKRASCEKDICAALVSRYICIEGEVCTEGCYCKSGYFRESEGDVCKRSCKCKVMQSSPDAC